MSVIGGFFNKSAFSIANLTTEPNVEPDVAFEFNFYIYDIIKSGTAKDVEVKLYTKDGRTETLVTNTPTAYLDTFNTWKISSVIPGDEWDGETEILMKFKLKDITDSYHNVEYYLTKG